MITYHGTADGLIPYRNTVNYYKSVVAKLGADAVKDHVGLYLVPGMSHCAGGDGASDVDWISALEEFDRTGKMPSTIPASHPGQQPGALGAPATQSKAFARPLCPYPQLARYKGQGDEATRHRGNAPPNERSLRKALARNGRVVRRPRIAA